MATNGVSSGSTSIPGGSSYMPPAQNPGQSAGSSSADNQWMTDMSQQLAQMQQQLQQHQTAQGPVSPASPVAQTLQYQPGAGFSSVHSSINPYANQYSNQLNNLDQLGQPQILPGFNPGF